MDTGELNRVRKAAYAALSDRVQGETDASGYAVRVDDNLLPRSDSADAQADFAAGAGQEREGKMRAPWSSSALALNAFGPWRRDPSTLPLGVERGFDSLRFEAVCPTGLRGTPPHLDLLAQRADVVVGVESKCTELLTAKPADFKAAYDTIADERASTAWFAQIALTRADPSGYQLLDVAQLVKHSLGLAKSHAGRPIVLLYLFWEPLDWSEFGAYRRHREEVERFAAAVDGELTVVFRSQSYSELWAEWETLTEPDWLAAHLGELRRRYDVELAAFVGSH